jgi:hypothetical protein
MTVTPLRTRRCDDTLKTYRYLRLGILGAVVALGASIGYEIT